MEEYAEFIQRIRDNLQKGMRLEGAVERAIEYCLAHGILADILRKGQMEVRNMLLEEYDEKAEREYLRKESLEEGIKQGREEGRKEGIALGGFEILAGLVEDGIISMDQAKKRVKERKEEFILWYQKRKKK